MSNQSQERIGLIAGNGKFPFLVLAAARSRGMQVIVAAIKEETFPEIEQHGAAAVHWLSLGELSRLIETFKNEGVTRAIMAGQVKHRQIFSSIKPDWRLGKLLLSLTTRNTDSLIGAVSKVLADEGITLLSSTALLEPMLANEGVLTQRGPTLSRCSPSKVCSRNAGQPTLSRPTSPMGAPWLTTFRASTSARRLSLPRPLV